MNGRTRLWLLLPALVLLAIMLVFPLGYMLRMSFMETDTVAMKVIRPWTLLAYERALTDSFYLGIFVKTLVLSMITTFVVIFTGFPLAIMLWRASIRWRGPLTILVLSPLLVSVVVSTYGWSIVLGNHGLINQTLMGLGLVTKPVKLMYTDLAIVIGLSHLLLPFMALSILAALERIEIQLEEAAATLGARSWQTFVYVILPLAKPGLAAGTTIVFCLAMSAYVTPALLGGNGASFLTMVIYEQFAGVFNWPMGSALAVLLMLVGLLIVFVYIGALAGKNERKAVRV